MKPDNATPPTSLNQRFEAENHVVKIHDSSDGFLGGKGTSRKRGPGNPRKAILLLKISRILLVAENCGIIEIFFKKKLLPSAHPFRTPHHGGETREPRGCCKSSLLFGAAGLPLYGERVYVKGHPED